MLQAISFVPGDTVRVYQKITEEDNKGNPRTRIQVFEGVVLAMKGRGDNKTFMVRKLVGDVAVERVWPILSPNIEKVEVKAHAKKRVRRAKLFYLRGKANN